MTVQKVQPSINPILPVDDAAVRQGHPSWTGDQVDLCQTEGGSE